MKHTDATARQFVKETLDPDSAKFDIDAIAEELRNTHGTWDFSEIEGTAYWAVVAKHDREAAAEETPHAPTDAEKETAKYVDDCSADVLQAIRKAMIERLQKRYPEMVSFVDEIMMHCVVDQVTIGIADAAQWQPQGN